MERLPADRDLLIAAFFGSLGGFVFGYDLGGLSSVTESLQSFFGLTPGLFGLTVSASIWGTIPGSLIGGWLADRCGREKLIALCAVVYAAAAMVIGLPFPTHWLFVVSVRFCSGMAIGGFTVACPLYLSEIAPAERRGRIVALFQLQVGLGVIVAFCAGAIFAPSALAWRWVFGLGVLPAAALLALASRVPRIASLEQHLGKPDTDFQADLLRGGKQPKLFRKQNTRLILVATSVALFNQLSGVNILLLYMLEILSSAGINVTLGHRDTVLVACLGLGVTLLAVLFVDRLGRKMLLYAGSAGMALCLLMLAVWIPRHVVPGFYVGVLIAYNACFAFSQGTVVWLYLSELFPPGIRGPGQGYGACVHWIANALLVWMFPRVQHASTSRIFYLFAAIMVVQIAVVRVWYPETRGLALARQS